MNFHSCRHMGHCWLTCWDCNHLTIQCMWKQCEHWPQTKGQSSPGNLQSGQQPSKGILQMPQLSSLAIHLQVATPVQSEIRTKVNLPLSPVKMLFTFDFNFHDPISLDLGENKRIKCHWHFKFHILSTSSHHE